MANSANSLPIEADPFYANDLLQMAKAHNYLRWQLEMVAPYVGGDVLEVGGGIGNFTIELAAKSLSLTSIEPNEFCHKQLCERTRPLPNVSVHLATVETLDKVLPPARSFDTIVMMNVLEHIRNDAQVLAMLKQRLKPTGRIVLLVPAGPWAFGVIDERLGHYRRYSKRYARELMGGLDLVIEKMRYFNFVGIWAWFLNAKFARLNKQDDTQIHIFDRWIVPLVSRAERRLAPPVGQSLLVVARSPF
jgi:SAM-dependent methyltransferase